jgi:hypothetical protein
VRTQPIDFSHADELIALALGDARRFLDSGGQDRPPSRMRVHRHGTARGEDARRRNQAAA